MTITRRTWVAIFVLACVQFTHILDFVIMMPLGPQLMRVFGMSTQQFGVVVSAYTVSAGVLGFLSAFFLDRFDRKKALIVFYVGFIIGTLWCALAWNHATLVMARVIAGSFGGVLSALTFSIIGDLLPESQRGRGTGIVMSAFSVASVVGVPLGLFAATHWSWHAPFWGIGSIGIVVLAVAIVAIPSMTGHIRLKKKRESPFKGVLDNLSSTNARWALLLTFLLVMSGFSIIPYISPYMVGNVGLPESKLSLMYLFGGAAAFFTSPLIGRLSDRFGKRKMFLVLGIMSLAPLWITTHMPAWPIASILAGSTLFFILISGRFIPAMAMITSSVPSERRGSFMSLSSSVQQLGSGLAAYGSGLIIGKGVNGALTHFGTIGLISMGITVLAIWVSYRVKLENPRPK